MAGADGRRWSRSTDGRPGGLADKAGKRGELTKELEENRSRSRSSLSQFDIESSGSRVKTQRRSRDAWLLAGCLRAAIHQHPTRLDDLGLVRPLRSVGCFWLAASDVQLQAGIKPGEPGIGLDVGRQAMQGEVSDGDF
jgi:hypothetical protein